MGTGRHEEGSERCSWLALKFREEDLDPRDVGGVYKLEEAQG